MLLRRKYEEKYNVSSYLDIINDSPGIITLDITYNNGVTVVKAATPEIIIGGATGMNINATFKLGTDNVLSGTQTLGAVYVGGIKADIPPGQVTITLRPNSYGIYGSGQYFAQ
ncbi:MAG: hypothetical protein WA096_00360 [Smithella sp.]|jgi:hypothetical protein